MRGKKFSIGLKAVAIFAVTLLVTSTWAATNWHEKVLHSFNGTDGWSPEAGLIFDAAGNLYGTTEYGGTGGNCGAYGCGTVFELTPNGSGGWTETVLYSFCPQTGCTDGANPAAGLIFDAAGNLYGTTEYAGAYNSGTVFELTPNGSGGWTETVLYSFCSQANCTDGYGPLAGLIFDASGNLYGTTRDGGAYGYGTVFELTPTGGGGWTETVLHSFNQNGTDGAYPYAGLTFDTAGNLYGTTAYGGPYDYFGGHPGTVFELTPTAGGGWTETVLYSFCSQANCADGLNPYAGLIFDSAGNLYGTTPVGGQGHGTVFELTPTAGGGWTEQVLLNFNGTDGNYPTAGLIFDAAGNLYGTTYEGGSWTGCSDGPNGCGTVFELTPAAGGWTQTVLHSFNNTGTDAHGYLPYAGLIFDAAGNLYGTTTGGGSGSNCDPYFGCGTVFELTPVYSCATCSHSADREVHVLPAEKREILERGGIEGP
jgi:uncharacterized repeat protein (TIGR03803 family)